MFNKRIFLLILQLLSSFWIVVLLLWANYPCNSFGERDLFITYADGYSASTLCPLLLSLLSTGFGGDIVVLVGKNIQHLEALKILLNNHNNLMFVNDSAWIDPYGGTLHPVLARFHVMFQFLHGKIVWQERQPCNPDSYWCGVYTLSPPYRYVITADAKDIFFQSNPSVFLEKHLGQSQYLYGKQLNLVVNSEGFLLGDHWWALKTQRQCTPTYSNVGDGGEQEKYYNAGTFAGSFTAIMQLMRLIYEEGRYNPAKTTACDQAILNQIIHEDPQIKLNTLYTSVCIGWVQNRAFRDTFNLKSLVNLTWGDDKRVYVHCPGQKHRVMPVIVHDSYTIWELCGTIPNMRCPTVDSK